MNHPYHFVALDAEQELRRRHLLDSYAQFAQLSILLLPLIYQLYLGIRLLAGRFRKPNDYQSVKEHQSPVASEFKQPAAGFPSNVWARLQWALDEEIVKGWGTMQEWLVAGLWAIWLLMLAVKDTGDGM